MAPYLMVTPVIGNSVNGSYFINFGDTGPAVGYRLTDYDAYNPLANRCSVEAPAPKADEGLYLSGTEIMQQVLQARPDIFIQLTDTARNPTNFFEFRPTNLDNLDKLLYRFELGTAEGGIALVGPAASASFTDDQIENLIQTALATIRSLLGVEPLPGS